MLNRKHEAVTNAISSLLKRENQDSVHPDSMNDVCSKSFSRFLDVEVMHHLIKRARRFMSVDYSCYTNQPKNFCEAYDMALSEFVHSLESDLRIWAIAIMEGDSNV